MTIDSTDSDNLIKLAQHGDQPAFELLVSRFLPRVYSLCVRYLKNQADAEDCSQEVFVKLWRNLQKFDQDKNFRAWVMEIAKNTCLDLLKKRQTIPFSAFDTAEGGNTLTESLASTSPTPVDLAEKSAIASLIRASMQKLSPAYRKVLSLYYFQDLNFRQIAEQLDEPLHTVKSRHRRAVMILRRLLD